VLVRDTKDSAGPVLRFSPASWRKFACEVKQSLASDPSRQGRGFPWVPRTPQLVAGSRTTGRPPASSGGTAADRPGNPGRRRLLLDLHFTAVLFELICAAVDLDVFALDLAVATES
jgi:Domain of unknown function (DUF397)